MAYQVLMVQVLIASPGDTESARRVIRTAIEDWNAVNSETIKVAFQPLIWERDATPGFGEAPQAILNRQLVDKADVLIGTFWTRLGTPTKEAASGTAEEIKRAADAQKPVMIYFSNEPVLPDSVDLDEYSRLRAFKDELKGTSLYDSYGSEAELARKVTAHLTHIARERFGQEVFPPDAIASSPISVPHALVLAAAESDREISGLDNKGRPKYRTRYRFIIKNDGDAAAENLAFEFVPINEGDEPPQPYDAGLVSRLAPGGSLSWPLLAHMGSASQWDVIIRWEEEGVPYEERQTVRM